VIRFVGGKPGGGKTLFAVSNLVEELRNTTRFIVTNCAIEMEPWVDGAGEPRKGLKRSMEDTYGSDFDCEKRIILIDDSQVYRFYAVRPVEDAEGNVEVKIIPPSEDNRFRLRVEGGKVNVSGCAYFIDEAHEFFASRDWQKTGKELLSWASQQRRAGDDAWFLTQVIENVEKQLRGVSQECYWLVNHRLLRAMMFRQPDMLTYKLYAKTPPGTNESYLAKSKVTIDREFIYGVYNTAKGVGVSGRQADIGVRAKGLHWSWLFAFAGVLVLAVIAFRQGAVLGIGKLTQIEGVKKPFVSNAPPSAASLHSMLSAVTTVARKEVETLAKETRPAAAEAKPELQPYVVAAMTSKEPGGDASGALMFNDGTMVSAKKIVEVWKGYSADGRFYSSIPNSLPNVTRFVPAAEKKKPGLY